MIYWESISFIFAWLQKHSFDFIVYYFFLNLFFHLVSHQSSPVYQQIVSNLIGIFSAEQKLSIFRVLKNLKSWKEYLLKNWKPQKW